LVNAAIVGGERSGRTDLAAALGKKGTESDIVLYNFMKGDHILAAIDPAGYPKSPRPLVNAVNMADVIVFCVDAAGLDASAGECIILLDLLRPKHGLVAITKADTSNQFALDELKNKIQALTKGTALEGWEILAISTKKHEGIDHLKDLLFELDDRLKEEHKALNDRPVRISIDHHFNVTGIGCVILGYVKQGTVNVHDKLTVYPLKQEAEVRSIQTNDIDVKAAPTGSRVGIALKGVQSKDLDRGFVLATAESVGDQFALRATTARFKGELRAGDKVHVYTGLQSSPAVVQQVSENGGAVEATKPGKQYNITIKADKEIAYSPGDLFLLARLEDPKQRFLACGTP